VTEAAKKDPRSKDNIFSHQKAVINHYNVSKVSEGAAYNLAKDNFDVYNTSPSSVIKNGMSEEQEKVLSNSINLSDFVAGIPDLVFFSESNDFFFVEVKSSTDTLTDNQQTWIFNNPDLEVYVATFEMKEGLEFEQLLNPEDLTKCDDCRQGGRL